MFEDVLHHSNYLGTGCTEVHNLPARVTFREVSTKRTEFVLPDPKLWGVGPKVSSEDGLVGLR